MSFHLKLRPTLQIWLLHMITMRPFRLGKENIIVLGDSVMVSIIRRFEVHLCFLLTKLSFNVGISVNSSKFELSMSLLPSMLGWDNFFKISRKILDKLSFNVRIWVNFFLKFEEMFLTSSVLMLIFELKFENSTSRF